MYDAVPDPYCYAGTDVLRNIPGLREQSLLDVFETASTTQRAEEPLPRGRLSIRQYQAIHRHLFQDVYPWAGRFIVRLAKEGSAFCYPENISREVRELFSELKARKFFVRLSDRAFAAEAVHFLATLNAIHPFREGNGRTQIGFLLNLADNAGHPIDLERLDPQSFLNAMMVSFFGDELPLASEIRRLISNR